MPGYLFGERLIPDAYWNTRLAQVLREVAYQPDGAEPAPGILARDLKWCRFQLIRGRSVETVEQAIRGIPLVVNLKGSKFSPAKLCTKRGPWTTLFERAVVAQGKQRTIRADMPKTFKAILEGLARMP